MDLESLGFMLFLAVLALGVYLTWRQSMERKNRSRRMARRRKNPLDRYIEILAQSDSPPWQHRVREAWLPAPITDLQRRLMNEMRQAKGMLDNYPDARSKLQEAIRTADPPSEQVNQYQVALEKLDHHVAEQREILEFQKAAYLSLARYVPLMTEGQEKELMRGFELLYARPISDEEAASRLRRWLDSPESNALNRYLKEKEKRTRKYYNELVKAKLAEPWTEEVEKRATLELEKRWA